MHGSTTRHLRARRAYRKNPNRCAFCAKKISYQKRKNKYCNRSCAAKANRNRTGTGRGNPGCKACGSPTREYHTGHFNVYCDTCIAEGKHLRCKPLSEITNEQTRKRYLLRTRPHRCEHCGRTTWLGTPIPLEMDHIDGNSDNNTEENLRLICPNCHALSPFSKGRNRGRGRARQKSKNKRYQQGLKY